jgi:hypothetical protein
MFKRTIAGIVLLAFINLTIGCHYAAEVRKENLKDGSEKIVEIAMMNGRTIEFYKNYAQYNPTTRLLTGLAITESATQDAEKTRITKGPVFIEVSIDSVSEVWVQKTNVAATTFAVIGVAAAVAVAIVGIAAALKESCPFVYSWDGQRYVFDAEPLGGAICQGLERSEYSRLDYLKPDDGLYKLKFRNEVPETQYLNQVELLLIDHAPDKLIVPDTSGRFYIISDPINPAKAIDENGMDIRTFVEARDGLFWQTQMTESELKRTQDTRHHLTFEFPKPTGARQVRLIVNAGTAIWGSNMIREMLQMRGANVDQWYQAINRHGLKALELFSFNLREEMYLMKLQVLKDGAFTECAIILGGGPFVSEDRVINVDVHDIVGDKLTLRVDPPKGFWTVDYLSVQYDDSTLAIPLEIPLESGHDQDKQDIRAQLCQFDSSYYVMAHMGDWADIAFNAPPATPGMARSIFLKTKGYYEVQIDKGRPEQTELINRMLREPGAITSYSIDRFIEWKKLQERNN